MQIKKRIRKALAFASRHVIWTKPEAFNPAAHEGLEITNVTAGGRSTHLMVGYKKKGVQ